MSKDKKLGTCAECGHPKDAHFSCEVGSFCKMCDPNVPDTFKWEHVWREQPAPGEPKCSSGGGFGSCRDQRDADLCADCEKIAAQPEGGEKPPDLLLKYSKSKILREEALEDSCADDVKQNGVGPISDRADVETVVNTTNLSALSNGKLQIRNSEPASPPAPAARDLDADDTWRGIDEFANGRESAEQEQNKAGAGYEAPSLRNEPLASAPAGGAREFLASRGLADLSLYWPTGKPIPKIDYESGEAQPTLIQLLEAYADQKVREAEAFQEKRINDLVRQLQSLGAEVAQLRQERDALRKEIDARTNSN